MTPLNWQKHLGTKPLRFSSLDPPSAPEDAFEYYWEQLIGDDFHEALLRELDRQVHEQIFHITTEGLITVGQWAFWCAEIYRAQLLNGGLSQFLFNCPRMETDVIAALRFLGSNEESRLLDECVKTIQPELDHHLNNWDDLSPHQQRKSANALESRLSFVEQAEKINQGYIRKWDEKSSKLVWQPQQFAPSLVRNMLNFVKINPDHFGED